MKNILKPIIVLTAICLVVTALLACVNGITSPIIKAAEEKAAALARSEVLKEAKSFEKLDISLPDGAADIFKGNDNSGYVIITKAKGYGGDIKIICGIRPDGSIENIKTLSHSETSGIGSKAADNKSGYNQKYIGKNADNYTEVDTISGATISSKAYKKAVGIAFDSLKAAKGDINEKS